MKFHKKKEKKHMKKILLIALSAAALTVSAQNKLDFPARLVVEQFHMEKAGNVNVGDFAPMSLSYTPEQTYGVLVDFGDNDIDYGDVAVEEMSRIGSIGVVRATAAQLEQLAELPAVLSVSIGYEPQVKMREARAACYVNEVQTGVGLTKPYTGNGVVAGLYDIGLDVNHINFKKNDVLRTKKLWVYSSYGSCQDISSISTYTTENSTESHGTHVLGMMAGSYNGPAQYCVQNGRLYTVVKQTDANSAIPDYGVATDADLAVACGPLADANFVDGVNRIIQYAKSQGKPAVVNLSIGNTVGPHDGTDAASKALAELGKEGIICIAAGNEGDKPLYVYADGETVKTFVSTNTSTTSANGIVQFWGSDNRPFRLRIIGYNTSNKSETFSYTLEENLAGGSVQPSSMSGFTTCFSGTVKMTSNINTSNNRYNVEVSLSNVVPKTGYLLAFSMEPASDQRVDAYAYNTVFTSQSRPGFTSGTTTISGLACGENVIVVGSFCTSVDWAIIPSGVVYGYGDGGSGVGRVSSFSSYGYTFQGRPLPDVCGPGEAIKSSYNQYYVNAGRMNSSLRTAEYAESGLLKRNSTWGIMQGTSMATPFVCGVIALWLEANPALTVEDVRNVIKNTSNKTTLGTNVAWGAGKIDALKGIKYVLENSGISDVTVDRNDVFVSTDGNGYEIYVDGASSVRAEIYNLSGARVAESSAAGNTLNLSTAGITPGVYVLHINGGKTIDSRKIVIR